MENQGSRPSASIFGPPMPTNLSPGTRARNAAMRWPPRKSPEASPATMPTTTGSLSTALANDAPLRALEEIDEHLQLRRLHGLAGNLAPRFRERETGPVEGLVGALDRGDFCRGEAAPLQPLAVDSERLRRIARRHDVRRQVLQQDRRDPGDRVRADRDELMRSGKPAEHGIVSDLDVTGKRRDIGKDRVVADPAIMRDMHIGHDPVVVADARNARVLHGAAAESAIFADGVAVADLERRRLPTVFLVLGRSAERTESENSILSSYASSPLDQHVRPDRGPLPYRDVLADYRIRPHRYSRGELRAGMNDGRRVNHIGRSVHKIFASAASASPTRAWAANFHRPRALRSTVTSSRSWSPGITGRLNRASSIPAK